MKFIQIDDLTYVNPKAVFAITSTERGLVTIHSTGGAKIETLDKIGDIIDEFELLTNV